MSLYLSGTEGYDLALREASLVVLQGEAPKQAIPLRRVSSVIFRQPSNHTLRALLAVVAQGGSVHFQDKTGQVVASLASTAMAPDRHVRELIDLVDGRSPGSRYLEWRELQLRHRASVILHRGPRGDMAPFEDQLCRYAARHHDESRFKAAWNEIRGLCYAWVDGELGRRRLQGLVAALQRHRFSLVHDLDRILCIPLLWALAPWFRNRPLHVPRERAGFFVQQHGVLEGCLDLALSALHYHLQHDGREAPGAP